MKSYEQTLTFLKTLNMRGIAQSLDEVINDAEIRKHSYITFLNTVFTTEISYRVKRRVERNMVGAHFPVTKKIDQFNFGRVKGIGKSEVVNLLDCRWDRQQGERTVLRSSRYRKNALIHSPGGKRSRERL